jgi:hypothetical protein
MDQVFEGVDFLKCDIDDVLVHNKGFLQHLVHLEEYSRGSMKSI